MFTLYTTPLSANGRKVMALGHHLDLKPQIRLVNVYRGEGQTPEYLAINPTGRIPALVEDGFILSESNAILQYISEAHGGLRLFSGDPKERALITRWLFWEAAHWQPSLEPVLSSFVAYKLFPGAAPAPPEPPAWQHERLWPLLAQLDAHLRDHPFLALDALTIADFSVGGMMTYFRTAEFPFGKFPNLGNWYRRLEALEAWQETEAPLWKAA